MNHPSSPATPHSFVRRLQAGRPQTIVFYGTSLTAGGAWTTQVTAVLEQRFPGLVTTFNGAGPGRHSGWGCENLDERVLAHAPDVVFLEFAVNDAVARFQLTPAQARANLNAMIDRMLAARPDCEIILQVMNPVIDRPQGHDGWRPTLPECQANYREVAAERGFLLIDHMPAWSRLLREDEATFRAWVPDGLHPAEPGYTALVTPVILGALGLSASTLG